jgi:hypothetical protein
MHAAATHILSNALALAAAVFVLRSLAPGSDFRFGVRAALSFLVLSAALPHAGAVVKDARKLAGLDGDDA